MNYTVTLTLQTVITFDEDATPADAVDNALGIGFPSVMALIESGEFALAASTAEVLS